MAEATAEQRALRRAFGQRVRQLRGEQSQEALAYTAGLDRSYIGQVERGERNVTLDNIHRLARALGVATRDLF